MKGLVAVFLGLVLASCSSSSSDKTADPQALCKMGTASVCEKVYTCAEGAPLRALLGASQADCVTALNAEECANATGCPAGQTYHADMAQACLDAIKAITCAQLAGASTNLFPPVCNMVCTAA
ncbi:MAG TPA: hypothetical protein VN903_25080 [Polyangia bacterium]|jgi:hypothetical protein|nr:hypothetical protein [Polyangia bacterium]